MNTPEFDAEELLHLAANLAGQQKFAEALDYLKQASKLEPQNGKVAYLMGMVYLQTGLHARGLETLQRAVTLEPQLYLAHFQIGLLLYSAEREEEASEAWRALAPLGEEHPLVLFKSGLEAFARDDFAACRAFLQRGIEINTPQGPLSAEMGQFLAWAEEEDEDSESPGDAQSAVDVESTGLHPGVPLLRASSVPPMPEMFRRPDVDQT